MCECSSVVGDVKFGDGDSDGDGAELVEMMVVRKREAFVDRIIFVSRLLWFVDVFVTEAFRTYQELRKRGTAHAHGVTMPLLNIPVP